MISDTTLRTDNVQINEFFSNLLLDYANNNRNGNWFSTQDEQDYDITFTPIHVMIEHYGIRPFAYVSSKWRIVDQDKYFQFKMRYL